MGEGAAERPPLIAEDIAATLSEPVAALAGVHRVDAEGVAQMLAADDEDLAVIAVGPGGTHYVADSAALFADGQITPDLAASPSPPTDLSTPAPKGNPS